MPIACAGLAGARVPTMNFSFETSSSPHPHSTRTHLSFGLSSPSSAYRCCILRISVLVDMPSVRGK